MPAVTRLSPRLLLPVGSGSPAKRPALYLPEGIARHLLAGTIESDSASGGFENDDQGTGHIEKAGRQVSLGNSVTELQPRLIEAALHQVTISMSAIRTPSILFSAGLVQS